MNYSNPRYTNYTAIIYTLLQKHLVPTYHHLTDLYRFNNTVT